jgi:predicted esterase
MSKLRILCLHGYTSNGAVHAYQVRKITKNLSSEFEFLFPDGPHQIDISKTYMKPEDLTTKAWIDYVAANSKVGHRAWWNTRWPNPAKKDPGGVDGLEESLEFLQNLIEKTGPVHAIWGFSQGGCFAGMLMALLSERQRDHPLRKLLSESQKLPSVGIFYSGFKSTFAEYQSVYGRGIDVPTLHIMGEKDRVVTLEKAQTLVDVCQNAIILKHKGAHDIPTSAEDQAIIVDFLRKNVQSRKSGSL